MRIARETARTTANATGTFIFQDKAVPTVRARTMMMIAEKKAMNTMQMALNIKRTGSARVKML
jgi:hypothetical protein